MSRLYSRLAAANIKNNRQFYLPYILTGILSVAMFYLMMAMQDNPGIETLGGGAEDIRMILTFGVAVVGVFVSIFLFYTNSFIMKRRKKELGVYNILGMEKKHIAKVLFLETLFTAVVSIVGGLAFGILFNKFLTMILYRLTGLVTSIPFYISRTGCINVVKLFLLIYGAALFYNLMQIKLANPIELLHSTNTGEREPKTKILLTLLGFATLGGGYYMALTVTNAIQALTMFFVAVLLVIVGTYCLFTAGSIALLKLLRKNKKYYYQTRHFTTVSGMIYRMKQNAVGLANICILSTMVLVTISTTVCMYIGVEDVLDTRYPSEISAVAYFSELPGDRTEIERVMTESLKNSGRVITKQRGYLDVAYTAVRQENGFSANGIGAGTDYDVSDVAMVTILTREDYERYSGEKIAELKEGEVVLTAVPAFEGETVILDGMEFTVKEICPFPGDEETYLSMMSGACYVVVPDEKALNEIFQTIKSGWNSERVELKFRYEMSIDINGTGEEKLAAETAMREAVSAWESQNAAGQPDYSYTYIECRQENRDSFYNLYGALFFLGMFLGVLFLMVTVLIIFYKQISEGYEDRERFAIMEKVGMSNEEVKRAIRSQVLTVFFLPIAVAVVHVIMAFPMITMLLECLNLTNVTLFAACVAGTALVFGIIYLLVYLLTSRSYYKIVGNQV